MLLGGAPAGCGDVYKNHLCRYAYRIERGCDVAIAERTFTLTDSAGLHARPAAVLVQTVQKFPSTQVFLRRGEKEVSGRSLLSVMSLGAGAGEIITVRCEGPQADEALAALATLLENGFSN